MKITLNNIPTIIETEKTAISVSELLKKQNFTYKQLIVKINNTFIKPELYETTMIKDGDNVSVIHLMTGG